MNQDRDVLDGWRQIADALHCSAKTAKDLAAKRGLPIHTHANGVYMKRADLAAWIDVSFNVDRLDGWKEIARALMRCVKTVRLWAATRGLPVRALGGSVYMKRTDLAEWYKSTDMPYPEHLKARQKAPSSVASEPIRKAA